MEKELFIEEEKLTVEELQEELDNLKGESATISIHGGIGSVLCFDNFTSYIDNNSDNEDILLLMDDNGINCDIKLDDIAEIKKDNLFNQLFITLNNEQVLQLWSEGSGYAEHEEDYRQ